MVTRWILLVYTVPAQPTRKRAIIWRELKKLGAVYVRDGVVALPLGERTVQALEIVAARVAELEGRATLITEAVLDSTSAELVIREGRTARASEYAEIGAEARGFLAHLRQEREHRDFGSSELMALEADVEKLKRWVAQVKGRDYFSAPEAAEAEALVAQCDDSLTELIDEAATTDVGRL